MFVCRNARTAASCAPKILKAHHKYIFPKTRIFAEHDFCSLGRGLNSVLALPFFFSTSIFLALRFFLRKHRKKSLCFGKTSISGVKVSLRSFDSKPNRNWILSTKAFRELHVDVGVAVAGHKHQKFFYQCLMALAVPWSQTDRRTWVLFPKASREDHAPLTSKYEKPLPCLWASSISPHNHFIPLPFAGTISKIDTTRKDDCRRSCSQNQSRTSDVGCFFCFSKTMKFTKSWEWDHGWSLDSDLVLQARSSKKQQKQQHEFWCLSAGIENGKTSIAWALPPGSANFREERVLDAAHLTSLSDKKVSVRSKLENLYKVSPNLRTSFYPHLHSWNALVPKIAEARAMFWKKPSEILHVSSLSPLFRNFQPKVIWADDIL